MSQEALSVVLEREHHEVDDGIEAFVGSYAVGDASTDDFERAAGLLRRHIYLEEAQLFPPLRAGGLMAPVFVMLREHGELWATLEQVQRALAADDRPQVEQLCRNLLAQLANHNGKEEPILYPQVDAMLDESATSEAQEFLRSGTMPDGWVCERAPV
jgi:hemerythrin-like domain-containing protein